MSDRPITTRYAPFAMVDDPGAFDLARIVVDTPHGTTVVHHRTTPGRPAVVLIHGVAGSWTTWTPMMRAALELGVAAPDLVLVDLPGWGSSPLPTPPLDLASAAEVVDAVRIALGVTSITVVGHSMGAFIALHLAVARPDLVERVVIVSGTTFAAVEAARRPWRGLVRLPAFTLLLLGFRVLPHAATTILRALARVGLLPLLSAPVFSHVSRLDPSVTRTFLDEIRPIGFVAAARSGAAYDTAQWASIRCPVVAIAGADDIFARREDLGRLAGTIPGISTALLADCGHFAHVERPFETLAAIRAA